MDAINSATISNSPLVLGKTKPEPQNSSFLKDTNAPKTTAGLVGDSINQNPASINRLAANVAAPAVAVPLEPSQLANSSLQASNLGSVTSVDALVKQNNDTTARNISKIISQPLSRNDTQSLKPLPESKTAEPLVEPTAQAASSPITDTRKSDERGAMAAAASAYTTTANYGQSGQGGSGSFTLAV